MQNKLTRINLSRYAFGWNYKAWSHAFVDADLPILKPDARILEIGASSNSIVSIIFDGLVDEIVISCYQKQEKENVEKYLAIIRQNHNLKSKYIVEKFDAWTVVGKFDIVLMKSVLGGLHR